MKNPIPKIMYSAETTFISREKIVAQRIIDENAHKPTRYMVPMEYSMKNIPATPKRWDAPLDDISYRERKDLAKKCVEVLREKGALTTKVLAMDVNRSARAVASALGHVRGILRESISGPRDLKTGHYSRETLWMLRVSAVVAPPPQAANRYAAQQ